VEEALAGLSQPGTSLRLHAYEVDVVVHSLTFETDDVPTASGRSHRLRRRGGGAAPVTRRGA
jgi:hypothetical protein